MLVLNSTGTTSKKKKRRKPTNQTVGRSAVNRRRGESSFIIYGARANIKFSNCKIDAAYVTLSLSRCRRILLGSHLAAASSATSMPRVSRVPSSFYCKTTPHIVQGRVIHFLPDSAQLFINCCSLGEDGTDLSSPRCDTTRRTVAFFPDNGKREIKKRKREHGTSYNLPAIQSDCRRNYYL